MKKNLCISLLLIPILAFAFTAWIDSTDQRDDGSELFDIWYTLNGIKDSMDISVETLTDADETLTCQTFIEPSDTGIVFDDGQHHIIWDIGTDVPNREFYDNKIRIRLLALVPGTELEVCGIVAIAAGEYHTIALDADGTVWTWGSSMYGQLGDGIGDTVGDYSDVPVQVVGPGGSGYLTDIVAIAAGGFHSVALKSDGTVWTWGYNIFGQLGDNTTANSNVPVQVLGSGGSGFLSDIIAIAAGEFFTIALKSDGTVRAWGENWNGQLGDNTTVHKRTPVQVLGIGGSGVLTDIIAIAAGDYHTTAVRADGIACSWGDNNYGQLGDNTTINKTTPIQVLGAGGSGYLTDIIAIEAGWRHTVAAESDGAVWTLGENNYGQLGDNTTNDSYTPVQVLGPGGSGYLTDMTAVAAGYAHTVALKSDKTVWAWGFNHRGQLGNGTMIDSHIPIQVIGTDGNGFLTRIVAIAAGDWHTVGLKYNRSVWTWGLNDYGQLGNGTLTESLWPIQVMP